jgi:hypothetical protein
MSLYLRGKMYIGLLSGLIIKNIKIILDERFRKKNYIFLKYLSMAKFLKVKKLI